MKKFFLSHRQFNRLHVAWYTMAILAGITAGLASLCFPLLTGKLFEIWTGKASIKSSFLPASLNPYLNTSYKVIVITFILIIVRLLTNTYYLYKIKYLNEKFITQLKNELYSHQLRIKQEAYSNKGLQRYLLRYSSDFSVVKNYLNNAYLSLWVDASIVFMGIVAIVMLNYQIAIFIFFFFVLGLVVFIKMSNVIKAKASTKRNLNSKQLSFVTSTFLALESIVVFSREYAQKKKFSTNSDQLFEASRVYAYYESLNKSLFHAIPYSVIALSILLYFILLTPSDTDLLAGHLIIISLIYLTIIPNVARLLKSMAIRKLGLLSISKINRIFRMPTMNRLEGEEMEVQNPRLTLINLALPKSPIINFQSNKGSAKTLHLSSEYSFATMVALICKMNEAYEGDIMINQTNIKTISAKSIRKIISVASVDYGFVGRTIYEAITSSKNETRKEEVKNIWQNLYAEFDYKEVPEITMAIGENGKDIKGIHREFLALCRALCHQGKIILVDDFPILTRLNRSKFEGVFAGRTAVKIRSGEAEVSG